MLEDLRIGVPVTGSDGKHLGKLTRIVIDRSDNQVTHLVIDPGLAESGNLLAAGGWEKPRERLVPVALVVSAGEHGLALACDEAAFGQQPLFERKQYTDADVSAAVGAFNKEAGAHLARLTQESGPELEAKQKQAAE